jgi:hypothetical protein
MKHGKALRLGGFVVALCASGVLVAGAVSGTGAYFTDSHTGEIDASTGSVTVAISPGDGKLSFANLLPGEYQTANLNYEATGTGAEDIWLVFPTDGTAEAFVGQPDDGVTPGPLGRYGHFAVTSTNGASFTSYNLSTEGTTPGHTGPTCGTDQYGEGGSSQQAATTSDIIPFCSPVKPILLASNLTNGQGGTATFEFGFTPLLTGPQSSGFGKIVNYQIVATQHGIFPNDPNNG